MGQRWDHGENTLTTLNNKTGTSGEDLHVLIKQLIAAAEPLVGKFNGHGKAAFDNFKAHADQISIDLKAGLGRVHTGQAGMEKSFATGDHTMAEEARRLMGAANFDAAKFRTA